MPTTRAPEAAARAAARLLLELPADVLGLVLYQLTLAHDIAAVAPTCHALCDAAKLAMKLRPFSGEVIVDRHDMALRAVAVAPNGRIITTSSNSRTGAIKCGARTKVHAHTSCIMSVAALPGGARFVSGSFDRTMKLWTLDNVLERSFAVDVWVMSIVALPDGVHFVVGLGSNCELRLYHVDGTLVHTFRGHQRSVNALAATHDGQHIISGSIDKFAKVWSVATKSLVSTCVGHTAGVLAVAAMPDSQRILSGAMDGVIRVWLLDGTLKNTFRELHDNLVRALVALPDNQHAVSASMDHTVKLFNVNDGVVLRTFTHHTNAVNCLALLPDGRRFISGSSDHTARIVEHGLAPQKLQ